MESDLRLVNEQYDWLLTIFYITYVLGEFQALMWKIVPPHQWAAFVVFGWGFIACVQAAIHTWRAEMALRCFLGLMEAGFGPAIPFLLSFFYLRHELGLRVGIFLSAAPLANTFAGALAYGITSGSPGIAKWRVLFLVEGLPTIVMAVVTYLYLPDSPHNAHFLAEDEKQVAKARSVRQNGRAERVGGIEMKDVCHGLIDPKGWLLGLMYFGCNVSFSSLPVFLPTILEEMGFSAINAQGLTAPPFFLSFLITAVTPWIADRTQQRGAMVIGLAAIRGVGYTILATARSVAARYFGVFLAAAGLFPAIANILPGSESVHPELVRRPSLLKPDADNQGSDTRRGTGIVLLNLVGQCGPLSGTRLYPSNEAPFYTKGQAICAAFMFSTAALALGLRTLPARENRKLNRQYGTATAQRAGLEAAEARPEAAGATGVENYGPTFRYVL